ncbi:hypothetical protein HJC99_03170 [Candidatus Saccharibacteria bacterium]|nr:hypothetical protein [Candidatus Saccharibacteria bacterium]
MYQITTADAPIDLWPVTAGLWGPEDHVPCNWWPSYYSPTTDPSVPNLAAAESTRLGWQQLFV